MRHALALAGFMAHAVQNTASTHIRILQRTCTGACIGALGRSNKQPKKNEKMSVEDPHVHVMPRSIPRPKSSLTSEGTNG